MRGVEPPTFALRNQWSKTDGLVNEPWDFDWFKTVGIKDFSSKYL
jgi:hypothetical protein